MESPFVERMLMMVRRRGFGVQFRGYRNCSVRHSSPEFFVPCVDADQTLRSFFNRRTALLRCGGRSRLGSAVQTEVHGRHAGTPASSRPRLNKTVLRSGGRVFCNKRHRRPPFRMRPAARPAIASVTRRPGARSVDNSTVFQTDPSPVG